MRFSAKKLLIIIVVVSIVAGVLAFPHIKKNRGKLLNLPFVQRIMPIYHSVRKIPDFPYIVMSMFSSSKLETYDIYIADADRERMNSLLPDNAFKGEMKGDDKLWVNAQFRAGDYNEKVKIRYRGNLGFHWNSYKKSYSIKFPKDNLFRGMRKMSLIIPIDRRYISASINNYRAAKMGLTVPEKFFVNVTMNGAKGGVLLASENWSQEWLEKNPISARSKLYNTTDVADIPELDDLLFSVYRPSALQYWQYLSTEMLEKKEIEALQQLVEYATDEEFKALAPVLLDLEAFYAQDAINVLAGVYHLTDDGNNLILIYDATSGKFKPVPYNASLLRSQNFATRQAPILQRRIWDVPEFRQARDKFFTDYVAKNSEDDIAFVDTWIEEMVPEFYRDNAKLVNNLMFKSDLDHLREAVVRYTGLTTEVLDDYEPPVVSKEEPIVFPEGFSYLKEVVLDNRTFVRKHPQFYIKTDGTLGLGTGIYYFDETIIVPKDTKLTIEPGTRLFMGEDVSIISFSPVSAIGTEQRKISVKSTKEGDSWGVVAIINTEEASTVNHVDFSGGGEQNLGGILFSGMLALHNASTTVKHSSFSNNSGDDALNAQGGSLHLAHNTFAEVFSDGVDTDFIRASSSLVNNIFTDIGGDAIDLSWSDIVVMNNVISGCVDKGVSVGERSKPIIRENMISGCSIAVAVKDQSVALLEDNKLLNNKVGVALYKKKDIFGGGKATLINNVLLGNGLEFEVDDYSSYKEEDTAREEPAI